MSRHTVLITGANGGIGQVMCASFLKADWKVIATDKDDSNASMADIYLSLDLKRLCRDSLYKEKKISQIQDDIGKIGLHALIHNAATQILAPVEQLTSDDWHNTMDTNLIAPFLLSQSLLPDLQKVRGSIINIASIHAQLTKPNFAAYATSKAALVGLTRSLAVELGDRIQVNAICPAAIVTPMLKQGFENNPLGLEQLAEFHPSGCLGTPEEVAQTARYLAETKTSFLNGAIIGLDGGIASRLHDPD